MNPSSTLPRGAGPQEDGKDLELLGHLLWSTWPPGAGVQGEAGEGREAQA